MAASNFWYYDLKLMLTCIKESFQSELVALQSQQELRMLDEPLKTELTNEVSLAWGATYTLCPGEVQTEPGRQWAATIWPFQCKAQIWKSKEKPLISNG